MTDEETKLIPVFNADGEFRGHIITHKFSQGKNLSLRAKNMATMVFQSRQDAVLGTYLECPEDLEDFTFLLLGGVIGGTTQKLTKGY